MYHRSQQTEAENLPVIRVSVASRTLHSLSLDERRHGPPKQKIPGFLWRDDFQH